MGFLQLLLASFFVLARGAVPGFLAALYLFGGESSDLINSAWMFYDKDRRSPILDAKDEKAYAALAGVELINFFVVYCYAFSASTQRLTRMSGVPRVAAGALLIWSATVSRVGLFPPVMVLIGANDIFTGVLSILTGSKLTLLLNMFITLSVGTGLIFCPDQHVDLSNSFLEKVVKIDDRMPKIGSGTTFYFDFAMMLYLSTAVWYVLVGLSEFTPAYRTSGKMSITSGLLYGFLLSVNVLEEEFVKLYGSAYFAFGIMLLMVAPQPIETPAVDSKKKTN